MRSQASIAELEGLARQGDSEAFGQLLRLYDRELRGAAWSVLRNRDAVDDAMQSAYEKAFRNIRRFRGGSTMKTWLHSVCYRTAIDLARYESRRDHRCLEESVVAMVSAPAAGVHARMEAAAVLASLRPAQRGALYLTAAMGFSFDEVAEITGVSRGTVASRVSRAKEQLRGEAVS